MSIGGVEMIDSMTMVVAVERDCSREPIGEAVANYPLTAKSILSSLSRSCSPDLCSISGVEVIQWYTTKKVAIEWNTVFHLLIVEETLDAFRLVEMFAYLTGCGSTNFIDIRGVKMISSWSPPVAVERDQACNKLSVG